MRYGSGQVCNRIFEIPGGQCAFSEKTVEVDVIAGIEHQGVIVFSHRPGEFRFTATADE